MLEYESGYAGQMGSDFAYRDSADPAEGPRASVRLGGRTRAADISAGVG